MKNLKHKLMMMFPALFVVAFIAFAIAHRKSDAATAPSAGAVRTAPDALHYPAGAPQLAFLELRPANEAMLPLLEPLPARITYDEDHTARVSSPIAGRVVKINVQAGDAVSAGQVLAELDSPEFTAALADSQKARADLSLKLSARERARQLNEGGVVAMRDLEVAEADARAAEAELTRAEARLANLGVGASTRYLVRAPIAGVVSERHLNPAQEVRPDQADPLFVITDPARFDVVADVAEQDAAKFKPGQTLHVEVDALSGLALSATVRQVGVALDAVSRRVPVRAHLGQTGSRLRAEMFARVTPIDPTAPRVVSTPNSAILTSGLRSYVFVETAPGTLTKREVTLALRGHETSYVAGGLRAGEHIVTRGALLLDADLGGDN